MEVHTLENTDMFHAPVDATVKLLVRKEEAAVLHMTFEPGQSLPAHEVNENAAFYVIRGNPTIKIDEEEQRAGPGSLVWAPRRIPHHIRNEEDKTAEVLVMRLNPTSI